MELQILDDNPAVLDLLGFDAVVAPVLKAIQRADTRPLTIGIRGGWGTGKSTLLRLIGQGITPNADNKTADGDKSQYLVLSVDPWEFESAGELRSTLVEMVLTELRRLVGPEEQIGNHVRRLIARVRFGKIAQAAIRGLATMPLDGGLGMVGQLVKGMTGDLDKFIAEPDEEADLLPPTMHGFRSEFGELVKSLHEHRRIEKIVVLVDDLDRCLPNAVVEILEAIKLFLSVDRMVFVIAADEGLVRSAISISLLGSGRASDFSDMYLEKIVQLPLSIPVLAPDDAVTYTTLLLCSEETGIYDSLREHCLQRRQAHQVPLLDEAPHSDTSREFERLARQICDGLKADRRVNPRQIKRFLNAFAVRSSIAVARGIDLNAAVMAKLMLLEEQYLDTDFKTLAATPADEVRGLLERWQDWALKESSGAPPDGLTEGSRRWAAAEPLLAAVEDDIPAYLRLAATLTASPSGSHLSTRVIRVVDGLIAARSADAARRNFLAEQLPSLDQAEVEQVIVGLAQRASTLTEPAFAVRAIIEIAESSPAATAHGVKVIEERLWNSVDIGVAARFATSKHDSFKRLADRLSSDSRVPVKVRKALSGARGVKS